MMNYLSKIYFSIFMMSQAVSFGQISVTTGGPPTVYTSINRAFRAINLGTHTGDILISVDASVVEDTLVPLSASGQASASYTSITIKPSAPGYTVSGTPASLRGLFELDGADRVTFDGSATVGGTTRDLTIQSNTVASSGSAVIRLIGRTTAGLGVNRFSLLNTNIVGNGIATSTSYGLYAGGATISTTGTGENFDSMQVINNSFKRSFVGIYVRASATVANSCNDNLISRNIIGDAVLANSIATVGIDISQWINSAVSENEIFNISVDPTLTTNAAGVIIAGANSNTVIFSQNKIYDLLQPNTGGWNAYGIYLNGGSNHILVNNQIYNVRTVNYLHTSTFQAYGIRISSGTGHKVYYNTVHLYGTYNTGSATDAAAYCLGVTTTASTGLDIRNNIFNNALTSTASGNVYFTSVWFPNAYNFSTTTLNNNAYTVPDNSTNFVGRFGTTAITSAYKTMDLWRPITQAANVSNDTASVPRFIQTNAVAPFTSNTDLSIPSGTTTEIESGATPIALLGLPNVDFFNINRPASGNSAPDMGAIEFNGLQLALCPTTIIPGTITATPNNICNTQTTLSLSGQSLGINQTYQWIFSTNNVTWDTIPNGKGTSVTVNQTDTTYYRCIVECASLSDTTSTFAINIDFAPFSGTFTINKALPTAGTNYNSFADLAFDLNCKGINGPVIANVVSGSGPYTEQVTFLQVTGASGTNTITINGNGEELNFAPTTAARHIIYLNGADYFTFNNLVIRSTNTDFAYGILGGNDANFNTIRNCTINLSSITSTTAANSAGIAFSGSTTSPISAGSNGNANNILNNTITGSATGGPYYGLTFYGNVATKAIANTIKGNTITDFYNTGIQVSNTDLLIVDSNDVSRPNYGTATATFQGIYTLGKNNGAEITRNKVHDSHTAFSNGTATAYPFYIADGAEVGQDMTLANNVCYNINQSGTTYGIYGTSLKNTKIYHNTINLDNINATGTSLVRGIYLLTAPDTIDIKNNIISITRTGTGAKHGIYFSANPGFWQSDYNNVYVNSSAGNNFFGFANNTNQVNITAWFNTVAQDLNTDTLDPIFTNSSSGNLTPSNSNLNNTGLTGFASTDINGAIRGATPDVGAFEFTPVTDNAGAVAIEVPNCSGTQQVNVRVRNFGLVNLDSVKVYATFNGAPTSLSGSTFYVNIAPGSDSLLNLGTFNILPNVSYNEVAFTSLPNGNIDGNTTNDTVFSSLLSGMIGTYTVNSASVTAGTNFQSFTDLAARLNSSGVCGPVVVNTVSGSGPYNEQAIFNNVQGTSAVNTVTINGNGETLTYLSTNTNSRAGFALNNTSYFTIDSFVIIAQGTTTSQYGFGIHLINDANFNTIKNNTIHIDTSISSLNYAGIVVSGSTSSATTGGRGSDNTIENNTINGGYYGIIVYSLTTPPKMKQNNIRNNSINKFFYYGVRSYYNDSLEISGNNISQRKIGTLSTVGYGIENSNNNYVKVLSNKIEIGATSTAYGIYQTTSIGLSGDENIISNNFITCTGGAGTGTVYGIYPLNCRELNIYHNNINTFGGSATAGRALYLNATTAGSGPVRIVNNNIVSNGTGYGVEISSGAITQNYISQMDYNNIYAPNGVLGRYNATNATTIAAWRLASSRDSNSISFNPQYVSSTDLHVGNNVLNNRGLVLPSVTTDIDGEVRCPNVGCAGATLRPDIGADEFLGAPVTIDLALTGFVSPTQKQCYTNTETVEVVLRNANNQTIYFDIDTAKIYVSVTGPNPFTFPVVVIATDSLQPDSSLVVTVSTNYDMSALGTYSFTAYVKEVDDALPFNDTVRIAREFSIGQIANSFVELCSGSSFELKLNNYSSSSPIQWQSYDPNTMTWNNESNIGSDSIAYLVTPTSNTIYRANVCGTYFSSNDTVNVVSVSDPIVANDTVCFGQISQLIAPTLPQVTHSWYTDMSSTSPIFVGDTLTSLFNTDTTVYVEASQVLTGGTGLLKITKIDIGTNDGIEIQNLSGQSLNTTGWTVAVSNSYTDINSVNANLWSLPSSIPAGQMLFRIDATGANYWGSNILWNPGAFPSFTGWAMIIDNNGKIVDAIFLNWPAASIANMNTTINGFPINITDEWIGNGVSKVGIPQGSFIARVGNSDNQVLSDFNLQTTPYLTQNVGLNQPFIGGSCISNRVAVNVKVNAVPSVSLGNDTSICSGGNIVLDAANVGSTYAWNTGASSQTISPTSSGDYIVTVTNSNGCFASDTVNVSFGSLPVVNLGNDTAVCAGNSVTFDAGNAGSTFAWSDASSSQTLSASTTNTYSVTVTNAAGCTASDAVVLTVNALPVVNLGNDTAVCAGNSVTFDAGNAGSTFAWSDASSSQTLSASTANTYSVTVTNGAGCSASDAVVLTVNALPVVNLGNDTAVCAGNSVTFDAGNAGATFAWSDASSSQTLSASTANTYSVTVTNGAGCSASDAVVLSVNALPVVNLGNDTAVCAGNSVTFDAGNAGSTFAWSNASSSQTLSASTANTYSVTVTNGAGCSASDAVVLTVNALPVVNLGNDTVVCAGNSVTFDAGNAGSTFAWSDASSSQTLSASTANTYSVTVTNGAGCSASDAVVLTVNALPSVVFNLRDTVCQNDPPLTLSATPAGGIFSGNGVSGNQFTPSSSLAGSNTITYNYTDNNGCSASANGTVVVEICNGIEDNNSIAAKVYPIPTNADIMIDLPSLGGDAVISVYAQDGRLVINKTVDASSAAEHKVELNEIASGVYTLQVVSGSNSFRTRIIKQ